MTTEPTTTELTDEQWFARFPHIVGECRAPYGDEWTAVTVDDRTGCCGATTTFHDSMLCCRACYREVDVA